ncbi:MAG TPA: 50S ribosomal protein L29 [Gemmatimonadaceae bacterium]
MPAKDTLRASDIREMSAEDIQSRIAQLERERFNLRFRAATQPLDDPLRLRFLRKDIARLKTILRERELGSAR